MEDSMDIQAEINEKVKRLEDVNKQLFEINNKIGALQEEGKAIYNRGLELKGAVDALIQLQVKEREELKTSKTAGLILPEGVKPVLPEPAQESPVEPVTPEKPVDPSPALPTAEGEIVPDAPEMS
jgi:hypothetical protein